MRLLHANAGIARRALLVACLATGLGAAEARAEGGRIEISQAHALAGGVTLGDLPGFPIDLNLPGSYVLTSNLAVANPEESAISIRADDIRLDLNGFEIAGPVSCDGVGSALTCDSGSEPGIDGSSFSHTSVSGGSVRGFGSDGISLGTDARISEVTVHANGGKGISTSARATVRGCMVHRNRGIGIDVSLKSLVRTSVSASNRSSGIRAGAGSSLIGNVAYDNGFDGIDAANGSTVRDSATHLNEQDGIDVADGCTVSDNASTENGGDGIEGGRGSSVQRSVAHLNAGFGLWGTAGAGDASAYRENTITGNGGTVTGTWVNMGANGCDGNCP